MRTSDPRTLTSHIKSIMDARTATVLRALVESVSENLESRTGVPATNSDMAQKQTDGGREYSATVTHEIPADWGKDKKQKAQFAREYIESKLSTVGGVKSLLARKGIK